MGEAGEVTREKGRRSKERRAEERALWRGEGGQRWGVGQVEDMREHRSNGEDVNRRRQRGGGEDEYGGRRGGSGGRREGEGALLGGRRAGDGGGRSGTQGGKKLRCSDTHRERGRSKKLGC